MKGMYLLGHDGVRRHMLYLLHTPTITLSKLLQILEVVVAQIILDIRVQVEVRQRVRERSMVRHALRARGRSASRRGRGARRDGDEAVDGRVASTRARAQARAVCGRLGLQVHRRRALFSGPTRGGGWLGRRRWATGYRVGL
jgi:hypothetical protein